MSEWTEEECRDQLCWCLDGKASEYYVLLVERNHDMAYKDLTLKIEKRFGFRELPETAQVQFNNACQTPEELLEDWADRVLSLATRAFRELPEKHMYQQAVVRFCQVTADKEVGSYASNIRSKYIEEAIDIMRWHQHNHQAIYGHPPRRKVKQASPLLPIYKVSKNWWKGEVYREVSPPILKREEKKQPDSPLWVNRELGSPPDTRNPVGAAREKRANQNQEWWNPQ